MTPYEELKAMVVMGFYEDRVPQYSQGFVSHELASPITAEEANGLVKMIEAKQARIDELMLEYCPDEMTEEQLRIWGESQRSVTSEQQKAIEAAVKAKTPSDFIRATSLETYGVILREHEEVAKWLEEDAQK